MASTIAGAAVVVPTDALAYTLRVVDAAGAPVAFTVALGDNATVDFHFTADEAWSEDRIALDDELALRVVSAATTHVVELLLWIA